MKDNKMLCAMKNHTVKSWIPPLMESKSGELATRPQWTLHLGLNNSQITAGEILTHFRLNKLPLNYISKESNLNFRYVRLCDLEISREKMLYYLKTVETLIRCRILRHLMWVCTVCPVNTLLVVSRLKWVNFFFHYFFTETMAWHFMQIVIYMKYPILLSGKSKRKKAWSFCLLLILSSECRCLNELFILRLETNILLKIIH